MCLVCVCQMCLVCVRCVWCVSDVAGVRVKWSDVGESELWSECHVRSWSRCYKWLLNFNFLITLDLIGSVEFQCRTCRLYGAEISDYWSVLKDFSTQCWSTVQGNWKERKENRLLYIIPSDTATNSSQYPQAWDRRRLVTRWLDIPLTVTFAADLRIEYR